MYMQRLGHKHCNFIWAGGYMGSWMQAGTPDFVKKYVPIAIDGFYRDQKSHQLVECGGDATMGCGSTLGGGGYFGLEQFVSYDPNDNDSIDACVKHMEDAIVDATSHGVPAGKEALYLQIGWSDERFFDALSKFPQQFVLKFQTKIKEAFDPNSLGDRNYQWLPSAMGTDTDAKTAAK
jgi:hypothetical protein